MWNLAKVACQVALMGIAFVLYKTDGWPVNTIIPQITFFLENQLGISQSDDDIY